MFIKNIAMAGIHVYFTITVQGASDFRQRGVGGTRSSHTCIWVRHWMYSYYTQLHTLTQTHMYTECDVTVQVELVSVGGGQSSCDAPIVCHCILFIFLNICRKLILGDNSQRTFTRTSEPIHSVKLKMIIGGVDI